MPRKPRESSGTGIYHVMLRGINRQDIFEDAEDYYTFIRMIAMIPPTIRQKNGSRSTPALLSHLFKKRSKTCPYDLDAMEQNLPKYHSATHFEPLGNVILKVSL